MKLPARIKEAIGGLEEKLRALVEEHSRTSAQPVHLEFRLKEFRGGRVASGQAERIRRTYFGSKTIRSKAVYVPTSTNVAVFWQHSGN